MDDVAADWVDRLKGLVDDTTAEGSSSDYSYSPCDFTSRSSLAERGSERLKSSPLSAPTCNSFSLYRWYSSLSLKLSWIQTSHRNVIEKILLFQRISQDVWCFVRMCIADLQRGKKKDGQLFCPALATKFCALTPVSRSLCIQRLFIIPFIRHVLFMYIYSFACCRTVAYFRFIRNLVGGGTEFWNVDLLLRRYSGVLELRWRHQSVVSIQLLIILSLKLFNHQTFHSNRMYVLWLKLCKLMCSNVFLKDFSPSCCAEEKTDIFQNHHKHQGNSIITRRQSLWGFFFGTGELLKSILHARCINSALAKQRWRCYRSCNPYPQPYMIIAVSHQFWSTCTKSNICCSRSSSGEYNKLDGVSAFCLDVLSPSLMLCPSLPLQT